MSPFLQLALTLAILLLAAKIASYISTRLGQPSVLGEILMGLLLGPSLINVLHFPGLSNHALEETVYQVGELGVLFLMFLAGLELHLNELMRHTRVSLLAGTLGVLFPVGLGAVLGVIFNMETQAGVFLGLTLAATSVSISAQTLMELKRLQSPVGVGLLGAAVFDDILVILGLSVFLVITRGEGNLSQALLVFVRMLAFLGLSVALGLWVLPRLARWTSRLPVSQSVLSLALVVMLLYSVAAEAFGGMAAITGAFIAGLMFARSHERERLEPAMMALAYGLFVPIFFISIGLSVNIRTLEPSALGLTLAVTLVAIVSKWLGAGLGARLGGFPWQESWQLGAGMISRGEVGLIVAAVGIRQGLATQQEFSAIVGMVVATTIITPPLLRFLFQKSKAVPTVSPGAESSMSITAQDGQVLSQNPSPETEKESP